MSTTGALRIAIGSTIRARRKARGLTLDDLSTAAGLSLGFLSQIELGRNWASVDVLYRVCSALGLKLSEVFSRAESGECCECGCDAPGNGVRTLNMASTIYSEEFAR
jgi:DNA-binding XRE family transcriptional regulator